MADSAREDESTTSRVEGGDGEAGSAKTTAVVEGVAGAKTTKTKTRGAETLRRKKNKRKMKELEGLQDAAEAKREGDLASPRTQAVDDNDKKDAVPKNENDGKTAKSEEGGRGAREKETPTPSHGEEETKTDEDGPSVSDAAATPTPSNSEESEAKANEEEEKNENEAEEGGEKKAKTTKKKSKKEKKEADPVPSPRAAAAGNGDNAAGEKKKKKKKKKAPKTPRGGEGTTATASAPAPASGAGSGIGAVTPLKLDEGAVGEKEGTKSGKKKGAQTERTRITKNDPPLSAVRAGPTTKSLASGSSHSAAAPPSPSAGVKFAQRLSLANVIPKLSTLPFEKKPRVFNSNIYTQSFSGKTLVKWMLEAGTGVKMDLEAMILGELMLNAGAIVPLSRKVEFSASGKDFYALTEGYADYARPRNMSVGGPAGAGSMIGGRAGSNDEMRRAARRSSVMLTFRSISMRGLNHLTGFAKEKDRKEDDQEQPTNLVYGKSLEEVMALQMISHPDEKIPIILKTLTKAIIDTQGHKTEGIFRVPGKNDEISRLKAQFNKMDYTITSDDPNDLGGCLKMWFRELKDPLIPNSIYDECVLVANNPAECLEMVNTRVPELNKTVIYFLLGFLQEMSRHAGVTRMGSANLGMVFAPGLLRCEDVMKMMTNTAHEGAFVKNLIEHYRPAEN